MLFFDEHTERERERERLDLKPTEGREGEKLASPATQVCDVHCCIQCCHPWPPANPPLSAIAAQSLYMYRNRKMQVSPVVRPCVSFLQVISQGLRQESYTSKTPSVHCTPCPFIALSRHVTLHAWGKKRRKNDVGTLTLKLFFLELIFIQATPKPHLRNCGLTRSSL